MPRPESLRGNKIIRFYIVGGTHEYKDYKRVNKKGGLKYKPPFLLK